MRLTEEQHRVIFSISYWSDGGINRRRKHPKARLAKDSDRNIALHFDALAPPDFPPELESPTRWIFYPHAPGARLIRRRLKRARRAAIKHAAEYQAREVENMLRPGVALDQWGHVLTLGWAGSLP